MAVNGLNGPACHLRQPCKCQRTLLHQENHDPVNNRAPKSAVQPRLAILALLQNLPLAFREFPKGRNPCHRAWIQRVRNQRVELRTDSTAFSHGGKAGLIILLKTPYLRKLGRSKIISQAQKIDCRAFVGEKYIHFFRNRLFQQNP